MIDPDRGVLEFAALARSADRRTHPEALRRPVSSEQEFQTIVEALDYWRTRQAIDPLRVQLVPPVDRLGDDVYDVVLAITFRQLAEADSTIARVALLQYKIDTNTRQLAQLRGQIDVVAAPVRDALRRIERLLEVLTRWLDAIAEAGT